MPGPQHVSNQDALRSFLQNLASELEGDVESLEKKVVDLSTVCAGLIRPPVDIGPNPAIPLSPSTPVEESKAWLPPLAEIQPWLTVLGNTHVATDSAASPTSSTPGATTSSGQQRYENSATNSAALPTSSVLQPLYENSGKFSHSSSKKSEPAPSQRTTLSAAQRQASSYTDPGSDSTFTEQANTLIQQAINDQFHVGAIHDQCHGNMVEYGRTTDALERYATTLEATGAGAKQEPIEIPAELKEDTSFASVFMNDVDLARPIYVVEEHYKDTGLAQLLARSHHFSILTQVVILMNALYLGIDSDLNTDSNLYSGHWIWIVMENFFCFYFTFEWLVRIAAFKTCQECFADGWMRFDTFLVVTMVCDTWMLAPVMSITGGSTGTPPTAPLRLLRLLKITRMARMMRAFPELVTLVKGLFRSLRAIWSCMILIILLLYVFAILLHQFLKEEDDINEHLMKHTQTDFKTMAHCLWTLWIAGSLMDGLAVVSTPLVFSGDIKIVTAGFIFISFSLLTAITILNMLIGVLCEVMSDTGREKEAAKDVKVMKCKILERLRKYDDGDGLITQTELAKIMNDPQTRSVLHSLNINELFLLQLLKLMYPKEESVVTFKPLTEVMLMCRGDKYTTVETMASGFSYVINEIRDLQASTESVLIQLSKELKVTEQLVARRKSSRKNSPWDKEVVVKARAFDV